MRRGVDQNDDDEIEAHEDSLTKARLLDCLYGKDAFPKPPMSLSFYANPDPTLECATAGLEALYRNSSLASLKPRLILKQEKAAPEEASSKRELPHLNPPAVETVRWSELREFIPDERWEIIQNVLDWEAFRKNVLNVADFPTVNVLCPPIPRAIQMEMRDLRYVKQAGHGREPHIKCPIFCIPRPDGKLRLIWDGRRLNDLCKPPPPFHLGSIGDHLKTLLGEKVKAFVALDMKTWFIQLKPAKKVAKCFGVRLFNGDYILCGLPMGWAWAPVIAQFSAEGVATRMGLEIEKEIGEGVVALIYIDNIIFALEEEPARHVGRIVEIVKEVAEKVGAVIKEDSITVGTQVEWLGIEVDAEAKKFRLKTSFIEKLERAEEDMTQKMEIRKWYAIISSCIYAAWTIQQELCTLEPIIAWMVEMASTIHKPKDWKNMVAPNASIWEFVKECLSETLKNPWRPAPLNCRELRLCSVGVSDASEKALAWAYHTSTKMTWCNQRNGQPQEPIFYAEVDAVLRGCHDLLDSTQTQTRALWFSDNMGAVFVAERGLSKFACVNRELQKLFEEKQKKEVVISHRYIPTKINPVDGASRISTNLRFEKEACAAHPGEWCEEFLDWIRETTKLVKEIEIDREKTEER